MKRALFFLLFLGGCPEESSQTVALSITPASLTRPCLVGKIEVFDNQGDVYQTPEESCNEGVIELPPGRRFAGAELDGNDVASWSVYLAE